MWDGYRFEENGKKLIHIEINCSFSGSAYFQIDENENNYIVNWRTEPERPKRGEFICKAVCLFPEPMPVSKLAETAEYKKLVQEYSPVYSVVLNENQKNIIDTFLKNGVDETVHKIDGRDGHSYFIEVYSPELKKYHCWCILPEEWSILADILNMLAIDIAGLDCQRYGCRTGGKL